MALTKVDAQLLNGAVNADSSGNVGIGTSSPATKLTVKGSTGISAERDIDTDRLITTYNNIKCYANATGAGNHNALSFSQSNNTETVERMRIDSSGNLLVGTTSNPNTAKVRIAATWPQNPLELAVTSTSPTASAAQFTYGGTYVGQIQLTSTSTAYQTSSDYRLKENIAPMQNALNVVQQLKPVTYNWKADGSEGQGFIAHELQEVVPQCVGGEKDAVDAEGNPVYQGIDTSFLVATLTAAIQELKAELDATKAEVAALKTGA